MTAHAVPDEPGVRLAEVVAALSLATDLGLGQPQEHVLRQTVIGSRLAAAAGLSEAERAATFYVSLLAWVGCVADSHELARWFGDDTRVRGASYAVDRAGLPMMRFLLGQLDAGGSAWGRFTLTGRFLITGFRDMMASLAAHCQATAVIVAGLQLPEQVQRALPQVLERWDGKGGPAGLAGTQIEAVMRVAHIASETEVAVRIGGLDAALAMLRERSGSQFDPGLVDLCRAHAHDVLADIDGEDAWAVVIDGCAPLDRPLSESELDDALDTLADYADLKSPWFTGHSRAVSRLAERAARRMGLPPAEVDVVRGAGLVARLGTIGVSAAVLDKPGPLSPMESERIRTVPYLTERIFGRQPRLAQFGAVAAMAYERVDGSGYPRGLSGTAIPRTARVLAAAMAYQAMRSPRPYRDALPAAAAAAVLLDEVRAGAFDPVAADAVLAESGHQVPRRRSGIAGLTGRELEVLDLLVRGHSNRQIADALTLSPKTIGSHVEHIYAKTGVSTRGALAMFAMRNGLVEARG
jgi:HD-GYP domain-containing protein (c-di-GMP phosphodiesterase class II)